jgi:O-antigen/teichoic acid export membrane protein
MAEYTGWNLFGVFTFIIKKQAIDILLNQFFNPVIVASRSIASTVNSALSGFSGNLDKAIHPQIVKTYAAGQKTEMISLLFRGTKGTYFLMYIFTLPIMLEMPQILLLWLKDPPDYAVLFTRLILFDALVGSLCALMGSAATAVGKMKVYQLVLGIILIMNFPISWIALAYGAPAFAVMIVGICVSIVYSVARLLLVKKLVIFSIRRFLREVLIPVLLVTVLSPILPVLFWSILMQNILRLCIVTAVSIISVCGFFYVLGLTKIEREAVKKIILNKIHR